MFVVCQSTAKTAKIGSLENFRQYGIDKIKERVLDTAIYISAALCL